MALGQHGLSTQALSTDTAAPQVATFSGNVQAATATIAAAVTFPTPFTGTPQAQRATATGAITMPVAFSGAVQAQVATTTGFIRIDAIANFMGDVIARRATTTGHIIYQRAGSGSDPRARELYQIQLKRDWIRRRRAYLEEQRQLAWNEAAKQRQLGAERFQRIADLGDLLLELRALDEAERRLDDEETLMLLLTT